MNERASLQNDRSHYTPCVLCGGVVTHQNVTVVYEDKERQQRVIHNVPAGVCEQCGEKYLSAEVAIDIERILRKPPQWVEDVGASDFATVVCS